MVSHADTILTQPWRETPISFFLGMHARLHTWTRGRGDTLRRLVIWSREKRWIELNKFCFIQLNFKLIWSGKRLFIKIRGKDMYIKRHHVLSGTWSSVRN